MGFFKDLESFSTGQSVALDDAIAALPWNADGLLPAIAQQYDSGEGSFQGHGKPHDPLVGSLSGYCTATLARTPEASLTA